MSKLSKFEDLQHYFTNSAIHQAAGGQNSL